MEVVKYLLENGAYIGQKDNDGKSVYDRALGKNRGWLDTRYKKEIKDIIMDWANSTGFADLPDESRDSNWTFVHEYSLDGDLGEIRSVLSWKEDWNVRAEPMGKSPLFVAAENGHVDLVRYFVVCHFHTNILDLIIRDFNSFQRKGADIRTTLKEEYGRKTALHAAARRGQIKVIRYLLDQGIDVNVRDAEGMTPLDEADGMGLVEQMLRDNGAEFGAELM